jgi:hypothetical protein
MPSTPSVDDLVRDLGSLIADRHALHVPNEEAKTALAKAVHDAGVAVTRTIGHNDDEALIRSARDAIELGKHVIAVLGGEVERSQGLCADSQLLRERAAQFLLESLCNRGERERRHRRRR